MKIQGGEKKNDNGYFKRIAFYAFKDSSLLCLLVLYIGGNFAYSRQCVEDNLGTVVDIGSCVDYTYDSRTYYWKNA